jgi:hypothetical protein
MYLVILKRKWIKHLSILVLKKKKKTITKYEFVINIVACKSIARQQAQNEQLYNSYC